MRVLSIGECMVELSSAGGGLWRQGFAGDSFNTAWYLRAAMPGAEVAYLTRLGCDTVSDEMLAFMQDAGIDTAPITLHPTRAPGLYRIDLTGGERRFTYWRETSAARTLAEDPAHLAACIAGADWVYFSGITLAILPPEGRAALLDALAGAAHVAFDPNLRPRLWEGADAMRGWVTRAAALADIVLPSFADEAEAFGDADPAATAARYGGPEVVVKNAGGPMAASLHGQAVALPSAPRIVPLDSTGAGDSFNGAYLAARIAGAGMAEAVAAGQAMAARVLRHRGALTPMAELLA